LKYFQALSSADTQHVINIWHIATTTMYILAESGFSVNTFFEKFLMKTKTAVESIISGALSL